MFGISQFAEVRVNVDELNTAKRASFFYEFIGGQVASVLMPKTDIDILKIDKDSSFGLSVHRNSSLV